MYLKEIEKNMKEPGHDLTIHHQLLTVSEIRKNIFIHFGIKGSGEMGGSEWRFKVCRCGWDGVGWGWVR